MDGELELLGERIAEMSAHLDAATHRLLTDLREFDQRGGWHAQGAASCAHWLSWRVGWDLVTARQHVRVASKLAALPAIDDALRRGEVSYAKVRAMVRIATRENESLLLAYAQLMPASHLEVQCRKYALVLRHGETPHPLLDQQRRYVRRRDTEDGMVKIEAVLHPEEAEIVWAMLNHAAAACTGRADAAESHDSAESQVSSPRASAMDGTPDSAGLPATEPACSAVAPTSGVALAHHDSVEAAGARRVVSARCGNVLRSVVNDAASEVDDSAKSQVQEPSAAGTSSAEAGVAGVPRDAAEPRKETAASATSLLERLLDEADASRNAAPRTCQHLASHYAPARPGISVLHQQEDATKRAFNRADALVSIAQGYLRGERPDRSPIEITLTMSDSSLRGETPDPIEVGELGHSFVSRDVVRRLSCDAGVVEVVEDSTGAPLSVGRKRRTISGSLKRALHRRDRSCTFPGFM
jgi:hypothetical protein